MRFVYSKITTFFRQGQLKNIVKLSLGSLIYPTQTRRWLQFLHHHPTLDDLAKLYPRLVHKIYRPYLSNHLRCAERVDLLIGHYALMFHTGFGNLIKMAAEKPLPVCEFRGKSGALYQLQLSAINDSHREGELCLSLVSDQIGIYSATFILLTLHGKNYIKVGCLHGIRSIDGAMWIKRVTRELHGCRPKNFMVAIIQDMGNYFGCTGTLLVADEKRISINRSRRKKMLSNYDELWEEMHAIKRNDTDFELPCSPFQKPDFGTIPSRKRSEARKRSELIESIVLALRDNLNTIREFHK